MGCGTNSSPALRLGGSANRRVAYGSKNDGKTVESLREVLGMKSWQPTTVGESSWALDGRAARLTLLGCAG